MSDRLRRVGILGHSGRPGVRRTALALALRLARQGRTVRLDARLGANTGREGVPLPALARWCQVLVTLGGDGTAITGARALAGTRGVLLPAPWDGRSDTRRSRWESGCGRCSRSRPARPWGGRWRAAIAVECLHAFSLAHDDLPALDDDDYRRGRLTTHRKFG
jgi:hypothetical protein